MSKRKEATLALADGTIFKGVAVGYQGETSGEVVFNTSMAGYQEIITDPSYSNQMLTFTYPHIGNVGANPEDVESGKVQASGIIVRQLSEHYSNFRATQSFEDYLIDNSVVGISGLDTRALVLHLRENGSQMGVISSAGESDDTLIDKAKSLKPMQGLNLAEIVSTKDKYIWTQGTYVPGQGFKEYSEQELASRPHVIALDLGCKYNILRLLVDAGFRVTVLPVTSTAEEILACNPDGVFLANGPGDPAAVLSGVETVKGLLGKVPMFGICLGHQILSLAVGAKSYKLKFGHRGGNHPVRDERTKVVEITVQNHGFAIDAASVPKGVEISHINLNDNTVEGISIPDAKAFSIQYHPESSPGPHDAQYLFGDFKKLVDAA